MPPVGGVATVIPPVPGRAIAADRSELRTVADAMLTEVKVCGAHVTVRDVRRLFADDHVHAAVLVSGDVLVSVVERADLPGRGRTRAARVGRLRSRVVAPGADLDTVRRTMRADGRRRLAVVSSDGVFLGLLCLKRDGSGFCSDRDVRARVDERSRAAGEVHGDVGVDAHGCR